MDSNCGNNSITKIDIAPDTENLRYNNLIELQRNKIMSNKGPFTKLRRGIFNRPSLHPIAKLKKNKN